MITTRHILNLNKLKSNKVMMMAKDITYRKIETRTKCILKLGVVTFLIPR